MAAASLVATAVGVLLLLITGYLLAGGIIVLTETAVAAEKDMNAVNLNKLGTSIRIEGSSMNGTVLTLNNTGSERISDFASMDVYLKANNSAIEYYPYNENPSERGWTVTTIVPNYINLGSWDPGETMTITVNNPLNGPYIWAQVTAPNGVSSSAYL